MTEFYAKAQKLFSSTETLETFERVQSYAALHKHVVGKKAVAYSTLKHEPWNTLCLTSHG